MITIGLFPAYCVPAYIPRTISTMAPISALSFPTRRSISTSSATCHFSFSSSTIAQLPTFARSTICTLAIAVSISTVAIFQPPRARRSTACTLYPQATSLSEAHDENERNAIPALQRTAPVCVTAQDDEPGGGARAGCATDFAEVDASARLWDCGRSPLLGSRGNKQFTPASQFRDNHGRRWSTLQAMKRLRHVFVLVLLVLSVPAARSGDLDGLVVRGTMKQMIGYFGTESSDFVRVGDTFEIDLTNLPSGRIGFTRGDAVPAKSQLPPALPFSSRLVVKEVNNSKRSQGGSDIRLSTDTPENRTGEKLVIQVRADELKKGFKATIYFYQEAFGRILCMAEAEGALQ